MQNTVLLYALFTSNCLESSILTSAFTRRGSLRNDENTTSATGCVFAKLGKERITSALNIALRLPRYQQRVRESIRQIGMSTLDDIDRNRFCSERFNKFPRQRHARLRSCTQLGFYEEVVSAHPNNARGDRNTRKRWQEIVGCGRGQFKSWPAVENTNRSIQGLSGKESGMRSLKTEQAACRAKSGSPRTIESTSLAP